MCLFSRHEDRQYLPEQSCGCPWDVAVGWAAEQPEAEPGAVAAVAAVTGREAGYG